MKLSRTAGYGISALLQLARMETGQPISCTRLAEQRKLPERFLLQVMRRLVALREVSEDRAMLALGMLERLALRRWSHGPLRRRAWALRKNLTAYDAAYVALAEHLECSLITRDGRLARSAGHRARVEAM